MTRYIIEQQPDSGRWVIVHGADGHGLLSISNSLLHSRVTLQHHRSAAFQSRYIGRGKDLIHL